MRRLLSLLALVLALLPAAAYAQDAEVERLDSLGRPFPDPLLVKRAQAQTVGGITMAGMGGAAFVVGMFVGSSVARGDIEIGTANETGALLGVTFGVGAVLIGVGIPMASTGTFTTKQLNRTIKGSEKVPRTVANEALYWDYYGQRQAGQALTVSGGGAVLMGVVATAGAVAIVGSEFYKPEIWAGVAGAYGGGAAMIVVGALLQKDADERMEALKKEVDPYYRQQASMPPRLRPFQIDRRELIPLPTPTGVSWSFRF